MKDNLEARLRDAMNAKHDELTRRILMGSPAAATHVGDATTTLDVGDLKRLIDQLPPVETWVASDLFPTAQVLRITGERENFMLVNASGWPLLHAQLAEKLGSTDSVPTPTFIDPRDEDDADTAVWRGRRRRQIMIAIGEAMQKRLGI